MKRLVIIGASGHGKVVADIAAKCGYTDIAFLDDDETIKWCGKHPVIGKSDLMQELDGDAVVAVGNAAMRKKLMEKIDGGRKVSLIHPDAVVAEGVEMGEGTVVMAGAVINPGSLLGKGCIVNTASSIDHDCKLGDYVHVAVGAHLAGNVEVGEGTWIGAGATVSNDIWICGGCMIGAGAVVVRDINEAGTYMGVPAGRAEMGNEFTNSGGVNPGCVKTGQSALPALAA